MVSFRLPEKVPKKALHFFYIKAKKMYRIEVLFSIAIHLSYIAMYKITQTLSVSR